MFGLKLPSQLKKGAAEIEHTIKKERGEVGEVVEQGSHLAWKRNKGGPVWGVQGGPPPDQDGKAEAGSDAAAAAAAKKGWGSVEQVKAVSIAEALAQADAAEAAHTMAQHHGHYHASQQQGAHSWQGRYGGGMARGGPPQPPQPLPVVTSAETFKEPVFAGAAWADEVEDEDNSLEGLELPVAEAPAASLAAVPKDAAAEVAKQGGADVPSGPSSLQTTPSPSNWREPSSQCGEAASSAGGGAGKGTVGGACGSGPAPRGMTPSHQQPQQPQQQQQQQPPVMMGRSNAMERQRDGVRASEYSGGGGYGNHSHGEEYAGRREADERGGFQRGVYERGGFDRGYDRGFGAQHSGGSMDRVAPTWGSRGDSSHHGHRDEHFGGGFGDRYNSDRGGYGGGYGGGGYGGRGQYGGGGGGYGRGEGGFNRGAHGGYSHNGNGMSSNNGADWRNGDAQRDRSVSLPDAPRDVGRQHAPGAAPYRPPSGGHPGHHPTNGSSAYYAKSPPHSPQVRESKEGRVPSGGALGPPAAAATTQPAAAAAAAAPAKPIAILKRPEVPAAQPVAAAAVTGPSSEGQKRKHEEALEQRRKHEEALEQRRKHEEALEQRRKQMGHVADHKSQLSDHQPGPAPPTPAAVPSWRGKSEEEEERRLEEKRRFRDEAIQRLKAQAERNAASASGPSPQHPQGVAGGGATAGVTVLTPPSVTLVSPQIMKREKPAPAAPAPEGGVGKSGGGEEEGVGKGKNAGKSKGKKGEKGEKVAGAESKGGQGVVKADSGKKEGGKGEKEGGKGEKGEDVTKTLPSEGGKKSKGKKPKGGGEEGKVEEGKEGQAKEVPGGGKGKKGKGEGKVGKQQQQQQPKTPKGSNKQQVQQQQEKEAKTDSPVKIAKAEMPVKSAKADMPVKSAKPTNGVGSSGAGDKNNNGTGTTGVEGAICVDGSKEGKVPAMKIYRPMMAAKKKSEGLSGGDGGLGVEAVAAGVTAPPPPLARGGRGRGRDKSGGGTVTNQAVSPA